MTLSEALNHILKTAVGREIAAGHGPIWRGFSDLADGAALAGFAPLAGVAGAEARLATLCELTGLPFDAQAEAAPEALEVALAAIQEEAASTPVVDGPDIGAAQPLVHEIGEGDGGAPPVGAFQTYSLFLRLTRVTRVRLTDPVDDADEIRIAAGTAYGTGGTDRSDGWRYDFPPNTPPESTATDDKTTSHILADCVVPQHPGTEYITTVLVTEEDWTSSDFASKLSAVLSIVVGIGVGAAVRYMMAHGLPEDLVAGAKKLLEEEGIKGSRDWFERLIGPELFEPVYCRATTSWAGGAAPVRCHGWISWRKEQVATTPPSRTTPGKMAAQGPITTREMRVNTDPSGNPQFDVLQGKGEYRLVMEYELVGNGAF